MSGRRSPTQPDKSGEAIAERPTGGLGGARKSWSLMALMIVGAFLLYANALSNPFQFDDIHSIAENPHIKDAGNLGGFFLHPEYFSGLEKIRMYRPILMVVNQLNYRAAGLNPAGWRTVNILIHGLCASLIYLIFLILPGTRAIGLGESARRKTALSIALIFLFHPVASEAVNYISARSSSLAFLFYLASIGGYLIWRTGMIDPDASALDSKTRIAALVASFLFFILALGTKEEAVTLIAILPLMEYAMVRPFLKEKPLWPLFAIYGILTLGYLQLRDVLLGAAFSQTPIRPVWDNLITQGKAVVYYIKILFMPTGLNAGRHLEVSTTLFSPVPLAAFLALASLIAWAIWRLAKRPAPAFGILWFFIVLSPTSTFIPLNQIMTERRLYPALVGFAVFLVWLLSRTLGRIPLRQRHAPAALAIALMVLSAALVLKRNEVWSSDLRLWSDIAQKSPNFHLNRFGLAKALRDADQIDEALIEYKKTLDMAPNFAEAHNNLANLHKDLGRLEEAEAGYIKALDLNPGYSYARNNLATLYAESGRLEEAKKTYQESLASNPDLWAVYVNLGKIAGIQKEYRQAIQHFRRALELNPEMVQRLQVTVQMIGFYIADGQPEFAMKIALQLLNHLNWAIEATDMAMDIYSKTALPGGSLDYHGMMRLRKEIAQRHPDLWQNWAGLGALAEVDGEMGQAIDYYRKAETLCADPDYRAKLAERIEQLTVGETKP